MIDFLENLTSANTWKRIIMIVAGSILILMALMQTAPANEMQHAMIHATRLAR